MKNTPLTIKETQDGLVEHEYSVVDLVDAYLARIKRYDKDLNCFITVSDEVAHIQAKQADRIIKDKGDEAFKEFPLLGVCIAHKDIYLTEGIRTTAGSNLLKGYVPEYSSSVVNRLQKAGTIILGKTNLDAWAHGSSGENSDFGSTKNPWNTNFVPGGSSSGSGASMAADFSLVSTGTDTCGSVRVPANYCGVYGLKPTYGSVSRYGVMAMASSTDSIGHFGRVAEDVKKVFNITKGEDEKDGTLKNRKDKINKRSLKIRIGIPKEFFIEGLSENVRKSVMEASKVFAESGVELVSVSLPHTKYGISVYYIIQPAEVSSNLGRYDGVRYGLSRESFSEEAKRRIMLGTHVLSSGYYDAYYLKAMKVRTLIRKEVDDVFKKVDALIAPVAPSAPFKLGAKTDDPIQMYLTDIYAATANLAGIPALAIPSGFTKTKLPLGFQLMGSRFSEPLLFELAKIFENATNYEPEVAPL